MKVLKITCVNSDDCHATVKAIEPLVLSVLHEPNNHVLLFPLDYTDKGNVKKSRAINSELDKMDVKFRKRFNNIIIKEFV